MGSQHKQDWKEQGEGGGTGLLLMSIMTFKVVNKSAFHVMVEYCRGTYFVQMCNQVALALYLCMLHVVRKC